jgi:Asp/Glu/hydantoin racemase
MRVLWQSFVDTTQNAPYLQRLAGYLNETAAPGFTYEVVGMSPGDRDFGRLTEFRCAIQTVNNAIVAEQKGFDGFVIGHFQDPGLYEARSAVRIPVVGAGEASLHHAAQLGRRVGLVTIDPVFEVWHYEQADRYGLGDRVVAVTGMGAVPEDFAASFAGDQAAYARMRTSFIECAKPLVAKGADTIIPAGVLIGLLLAREHGFAVDGAPVVNCASVALKAAEMWIALHKIDGLEPSRGPSFALAPKRAIEDFQGFVKRGLGNE